MNKKAQENAQEYLTLVKELFPEVKDQYAQIADEGKTNKIYVSNFLEKTKKILSIIKNINTDLLATAVNKEILEKIEKDLNFIHDEVIWMQNSVSGQTLYNDLLDPVIKYIKNLSGTSAETADYRKWAKDKDELAKKYIAMLTHPNNIETYKNQIRRMSMGTMSQKEFNKIYNATKHKMIPLPTHKFESFNEYLN